MQRAISIALSLAAVILSAVLAFNPRAAMSSASPATASASAPLPQPSLPVSGGREPDAGSLAPLAPDMGGRGTEAHSSDDARAPAPLTGGPPRHIRLGIVLVTYAGAEGTPDHGARTKSEALGLAARLADEAKADFHAAVQHGDPGSTDDLGTIARGVIEPSSEAVVFALPVGQVSGVLDTPRGFWIAKRLE